MPEPQIEPITHKAVGLLEGLTSAYQDGKNIKIQANEFTLLDALNSPDFSVSSTANIQIHKLCEKLTNLVVNDERFAATSPLRHAWF